MSRKLKRNTKVEDIIESSKEPVKRELKILTTDKLIPSGSTMINLACSDNPFGAYVKGTIVNIIGDTSAGKSFLILTMLAEICYDKRFDKYDLYYDDVEQTLEFDLKELFGLKFVKRIKLKASTYAEEVWDNIFAIKKSKTPFIYAVDSWDALKSHYEEKKESVNVGKRARGQKEEGSYGDGKAKILHKICRQSIKDIEREDSLLIFVSQTKDNWGPDAQFNPKIVTGGNAIKFFPSHRVWLTIIGRDYELKREIGVESKVKVVKNKFTGKRRNVNIPIYYSYGVDDIGSCVRFLNSDFGGNYWKTKTKKIKDKDKSITAIDAIEFNIFLKEKELIRYIEDNNLEKDLKLIVGKVWIDLEEKVKLDRKPKY